MILEDLIVEKSRKIVKPMLKNLPDFDMDRSYRKNKRQT